MKASDIRPGILVQDKDGKVIRVVASSVLKVVMGSVCVNPIYTGIPITEEWLRKAGFEKKRALSFERDIDLFGGGKRLIFSGDYLYIADSETQNSVPEDLITIWNKDVMKEFYVHQLQNLYYALTGEELQFENID